MPFKNIQKLIDDAPQISQWWRTNQKSAHRWNGILCVSYLVLLPMGVVGGSEEYFTRRAAM